MKFKEYLNSRGIHNDWNLLQVFGKKNKDVFVHFRAGHRSWEPPKFVVTSPSHQTDPGAHHMDHGCKTFSRYTAATKEAVMEIALAWVADEYGITEWAPSPFGGGKYTRVPKYVADAAKAAWQASKGKE